MEIPNSESNERAFLSCVFSDNGVLVDEGADIKPTDFFKPQHAQIFGAMKRLHSQKKGIDIFTMTEELKKSDELHSVGGIAYLTQIQNAIASTNNVKSYVENVVENAKRREILKIASEAMDSANDLSTSPSETLSKIQESVTKSMIRGDGEKLKSSVELSSDFLIWFDERYANGDKLGLPTGIEALTKAIHGFQRGDVIILAARPGMGKTALMLNFVSAVCQKDYSTYVVSCEMTRNQLMARLISMTMEVDASKVFFPTKETLTDEDTDRIVVGADRISKWKMRIDNNAKDIDKLISKARRLKASMGLDMIVIDYIQLLHDSAFVGGNRSSELESISGKLKGLALELEVPVVALSQLSRSVEKSGAGKTKDRHGDISDIKDSGSIEQDADVIMFLYRDAYYDETSTSNLAEITIKKQRNGEQKKVRCHFLGNYSKFIPLADESNYSQ